jgi:hypothetical protein
MVAPPPTTPALLRRVVALWRAVVKARRQAGGLGALAVSGLLSATIYAVSHDPPLNPGDLPTGVVPLLDELLGTDEHLRATCRSPYGLAVALQQLVLYSITYAPELDRGGDAVDARIAELLLDELFSGEYRRRLYCRLYNVVVDESRVDLSPMTGSIETVRPAEIPAITGEVTGRSRLHRDGTGDAFLVFEDRGYGDDTEWFNARWQREVWPILQTIKYVKYAIVDIDYTALRYDPPWVNAVRRSGVSLGGRPRLDVQPRHYELDQAARTRLGRYLAALKKHEAIVTDMTPTLRQALETAGGYYEGHHGRGTPADQLIDLVIALESLFSPPNERQELSYRVALTAATMLGHNADTIEDLFDFIRDMYGARSRLVHRGQNPFTARKAKDRVELEDLDQLGDLVRQAILRTAVLLARGDHKRDRQAYHAALSRAVFDHVRREEIQARSDIDRFLDEEGL